MSEIERVNLSIDAHFQVYGDPKKHPKEMGELAHALVKCVCAGTARAQAKAMETRSEVDPELIKLLVKAEGAAQVLDAATQDPTMSATIESVLVNYGWEKADAADPTKNPFVGQTSDKVLSASNFKLAAELAMIARRAQYPLDGASPWDDKIDPKVALYDPDDIYSFGIFDTFIDPIQELLPPLFRLASEGWTEGPTAPQPTPVVKAVVKKKKKAKAKKRGTGRPKCSGLTKKGTPCRLNVAPGKRSYCEAHSKAKAKRKAVAR